MIARILTVCSLGLALGSGCLAQDVNNLPAGRPLSAGQDGGQGRRSGMGGMMPMGRGIMGTVTQVAPDRFTVKNGANETYTIHFGVNTRIMKQPAGPAGRDRPMGGGGAPPQAIKATDIKVGDAIAAGGETDEAAKSVGAVFVMLLDPERARTMREIEANFGKTWLMGRVTAVNEAKVTLHSGVDNADHTFTADENTTFRRRRDPITLPDVQVGDNVRVDGAVKGGQFMAAAVTVMMPPANGGPARRPADEPKQ